MPEQQTGHGHRIVAGVDGSASSLAALRWAIRQAELTGSRVDAVLAWQPPAASGLGWGAAMVGQTEYAELAEKTLVQAIDQAANPASPVKMRPMVGEGNAAQVLLDASAGADCWWSAAAGTAGSPVPCSAPSASTAPTTRTAPSWSSAMAAEDLGPWSALVRGSHYPI